MFLLISSYIADLIFGDPEWLPHPVRWMGKLINILENRLKGNAGKEIERMKGTILAFLVVVISAGAAYLLMGLCRKLNPSLGVLTGIYLGYTTLSIKDLRIKTKSILRELEKKSTVEARRQLSKIVGRDTQDLNQKEIITASVESVAENSNDGIVAPLFYLALGGPVLAISYKAINTLDSMVGYKNEKYLDFGWFSARLDDLANFIPARICGFLISLSCGAVRGSFKDSFKTMLKDGTKHLSPNSGISEAAMAGALGIRLGGPSAYQGKVIVKPYLGEEKRAVEPSCINEALTISLVASIFMVFIGVFLKWII